MAARKRTDEILRDYGIGSYPYQGIVNPLAVARVNWPKVPRDLGISASAVAQMQKIMENQHSIAAFADTWGGLEQAAKALNVQPYASTVEQIAQLTKGLSPELLAGTPAITSLIAEMAKPKGKDDDSDN